MFPAKIEKYIRRREIPDYFRSLHRYIGHISGVDMQRYVNQDFTERNRDLRVNYLLEELDEGKWEIVLRKRKMEKMYIKLNILDIVKIKEDLKQNLKNI